MPRAKTTTPKPESSAKTLAVVYARVSTKEQREEGYSIDAQISLLLAYCQSRGLTVVEIIQEAETAAESGRPGFARVLTHMREGTAGAVVVEKTDRLYRNLRDRINLSDLKPDIHLVKEATVLTETSRSHEKFVHDIKLVVAKNYVDNLKEETAKGMTSKAKAGIWPTGAPVGYVNTVDGHRKVIAVDNATAGIVQRIFTMYATGDHSFAALAATAGTLGLKTKKGSKLGATGIQWLLRNPIYCGIIRWNGIDYPGIHEPIVSPELWQTCQEVLEGRNPTKVPRTRNQEYSFRGLVRCGDCDCLMSPYTVRKKNGLEFIYYACTGAKGCKRVNHREEWIAEQFRLHLEGLCVKPSVITLLREALKDSFGTIDAEDAKTTEFLRQRKAKLEKSLENLYLDKLAGEIDGDRFYAVKARLLAEIADIDKELLAADNAKRATWEQTAAFIEMVSNSAVRFAEADKPAKRVMFESAVSNSWIQGGKLILEPELWFKLIFEANASSAEMSDENAVRTVWLPNVDSNHD